MRTDTARCGGAKPRLQKENATQSDRQEQKQQRIRAAGAGPVQKAGGQDHAPGKNSATVGASAATAESVFRSPYRAGVDVMPVKNAEPTAVYHKTVDGITAL